MLIEIHILQNHAPSNLNRDDTGSPKECIFGGVRRARISSQCLKRSIRRSDIIKERIGDILLGTRTRRLPRIVKENLLNAGVSETLAELGALKATGFGTKEGKEREKEMNTAQTIFLAEADIKAISEAILESINECKDEKEFKKVKTSDIQNKAVLKGWRPITPDIALFGRMTTSEAFHDVEASMQVAHAISVNKLAHEFDYFTAIDDLQSKTEQDEGLGADMIGDIEFNSSCYYKYFSLNYDELISNLAGPEQKGKNISQEEIKAYEEDLKEAKETAEKVITAFLEAAVFTSPTGKQNSFAAHQVPDGIMIEIRPRKTPISYANAFVKDVKPEKGNDLVEQALNEFKEHVELINDKYSLNATGRYWFTTRDIAISGTETCENFNELIKKLENSLPKGD